MKWSTTEYSGVQTKERASNEIIGTWTIKAMRSADCVKVPELRPVRKECKMQ